MPTTNIDFNAQPVGYDNTGPVYTQKYVGDHIPVNSQDLIMRPDVLQNLFPHLMEETDFIDFFIQSGRTEKTANTEFHHYEDVPLIPLPQIKTVSGTPGNGNPVTITIEALNADKKNPFKRQDLWEIGGVEGWVEADDDITENSGSGEHQVVLKPATDENIVAAAVEGEFMIWVGAAAADGTIQPPGMFNVPQQFTDRCQIIKTSFETDDSASGDMTFLPISKSGKQYAYYRGVDQAFVRQKMAIALRLGIGKGTTNLVDADNGNKPVYTTTSFDKVIRQRGLNEPYPVQFDFNNWYKINKALNKQNAPKEYIVPAGDNAYHEAMKIVFNSGNQANDKSFDAFKGTDWSRYGKANPQERALDLGFNSMHVFDRTYHFKNEKFLNYKQITGAPGMIYPDTLYFLPMGKYSMKNPDTGEIKPTEICRVRYKASDKKNMMMEFWIQDKRQKDDGKAVTSYYHSSILGWQQAMAHWAVRAYKDVTASS